MNIKIKRKSEEKKKYIYKKAELVVYFIYMLTCENIDMCICLYVCLNAQL